MSTFALVALHGCGSDDNSGDTSLPPEETMYLSDPADVETNSQALCASDTAAYDVLHAFIDAHNEEIQQVVDLIQAVVKTEQVKLQREGEVQYSVTIADRTLTFVATLADDGAVDYVATFVGPNVGTYTLMSGHANAERTAGNWSINGANGNAAITVTWTRTDAGDLHVLRTILNSDRTATYDRVGDTTTIVFAGTNNQATASWSTTTGAGSITINGESEACFSRSNADFCTVACP